MSITVLPSIREKSKDTLREQLAFDVLKGFSAKPKSLPSKYFYDEKGSLLFEEITSLDEYYLTKAEHNIFALHKDRFAEAFARETFNLIELGAGDGRKSKLLLSEFAKRGLSFTYYPIDISETAVESLASSVESELSIQVEGIVGEYFDGIRFIKDKSKARNVVFFLGSTIGNFDLRAAQTFLHFIWQQLNDQDYMLIGFDLKKDIDQLTAAYNDRRGITARFNLNLLHRLNEELRANFQVAKYRHHGFYNPRLGAMESYLISLEEQVVYIGHLERSFKFKAYEPIHLEYSYKYLASDIQSLANETGFQIIDSFYDDKKQFVDSLWQVKKDQVKP